MRSRKTMNWRYLSLALPFALLAGCQSIMRVSMNPSKDMLSFASFEKAGAAVSLLEESGLHARHSIEGLSGFDSMLDLFLSIDSLTDEAGLDAFMEKHAAIVRRYERVDAAGNTDVFYNLKIPPAYAAIVNPSGEVMVGKRVYSLLLREDAEAFNEGMRKAFEGQVKSASEGPVRLIPMWAGLTLGDKYPTTDFRTTIDGRATIVQLWKGYYPAALGVGGVGAEVGLYHASSPSASIWFPDYRYPRDISYALVHKRSGTALIRASGRTWWLNAWKLGTYSPSLDGNEYTLYYSIEGVEGAW